MKSERLITRVEKYSEVFSASVLASLALAVGIAVNTPPIQGYELIFYNAFHVIVWITLCYAIIGATILLVLSDIIERISWYRGFMCLAGAYALLFALPYIHGYAITGTASADALYHLGSIRQILETAHAGEQNWYPMTHFLGATLVQVLGIPLRLAQPVIAYTISIGYILFLGTFERKLLKTTQTRAFGSLLAASSPLLLGVFQTALHPAIIGFMLTPLVLLYIQIVWDNIVPAKRSGLIFLLIPISLWHPVSALLNALAIAVMGFFDRRYHLRNIGVANLKRTGPIAVILAVFFYWYTNFDRFQFSLGIIFGLPTTDVPSRGTGSGSGIFHQFLTQLESEQISPLQLFWSFIVRDYGAVLLYAATAGTVAIVILIVGELIKRNYKAIPNPEWMLIWQFFTGIIVAILFLFLNLIAANPVRISRYYLFAGMCLIGIVLAQLLHSENYINQNKKIASKARIRTVILPLLIVVILTSSLLAVGTIHPPGYQLSKSTISGADWMMENTESDEVVKSLAISHKLELYLEGTDRTSLPSFSRNYPNYQLPTHIGYQSNATVARLDSGPTYFVTRERSRQWYMRIPPDRRSDIRYYTPKNIKKLNSDTAANRIYSNGQFEGWLTKS